MLFAIWQHNYVDNTSSEPPHLFQFIAVFLVAVPCSIKTLASHITYCLAMAAILLCEHSNYKKIKTYSLLISFLIIFRHTGEYPSYLSVFSPHGHVSDMLCFKPY